MGEVLQRLASSGHLVVIDVIHVVGLHQASTRVIDRMRDGNGQSERGLVLCMKSCFTK